MASCDVLSPVRIQNDFKMPVSCYAGFGLVTDVTEAPDMHNMALQQTERRDTIRTIIEEQYPPFDMMKEGHNLFSFPELYPNVRTHVRLLELPVGIEKGQPLQCRMTVQELDNQDSLPFAAISYTWGRAPRTRAIEIDGRLVPVTNNCLYALLQAISWLPSGAFYDAPSRVWVDAICINQADDHEKDAQVAMMGRIFSRATVVLACIGESGEDEPLFENDPRVDFQTPFRDIAGPDGPDMVQYLASRTYFTRLWTVQECIIPRRLWVACGTQVLLWSETIARCKSICADRQCPDDAYARLISLDHDARCYDPEPALSLGNNLDLLSAVMKYSYRECSNLRDKVYGLLPLTDHDTREAFEIQYAQPLLHTLMEYLRILLSALASAHFDADPIAYLKFMKSLSILANTFCRDKAFLEDLGTWMTRRVNSHINQASATGLNDAAGLAWLSIGQQQPIRIGKAQMLNDVSRSPLALEFQRSREAFAKERLRKSSWHRNPLEFRRAVEASPILSRAILLVGGLEPATLNASVISNDGQVWLLPSATQLDDLIVSCVFEDRSIDLVVRKAAAGRYSVVGVAVATDLARENTQAADAASRYDYAANGRMMLHPEDLMLLSLAEDSFLDCILLVNIPLHAQTAVELSRPPCY